MVDQSFPESVRMILVVNPRSSLKNVSFTLTLPPSFLQVTLTTPYRSTIAITSLARFIAKCNGLVVPEGDFGSDVEGIKPIFFDVGNDERKMTEALEHCRKVLGDKATILYQNLPDSIEKVVKEKVKEAGGLWDCYNAGSFYGWEVERVLIVTDGYFLMEMITRAKTHLFVILVEEHSGFSSDYDYGCRHANTEKYFQQAAKQGLVEIVQLSGRRCY